jgi:3-isopropylmalate/(R)-2-methylmalate dehydratase small subunit
MIVTGRAVRLGDSVNTDNIVPGAYLNITDPALLGPHLLETYPGDAGQRIRPGDIVVAGTNFGMGSSREHAQLAFLARGVSTIVAASFARIFLRNCVNVGLNAIVCPAAAAAVEDGQELTIDLDAGVISSGGRDFAFRVHGPFVRQIVAAGGLVNWTRERVNHDRRASP